MEPIRQGLNALTGILCFSTTAVLLAMLYLDKASSSQCPDGHSLFFHVGGRPDDDCRSNDVSMP